MKKIKTIGILGCLLVLTLSFVSAALIWDDDSTSVTLIGMNCPSPKNGWVDSTVDPPIKYNTVAKGEERIYDCRDPVGDPRISACCPDGTCDPAPSGMIVSPLPGYFIDNQNFTCQASLDMYCGRFTTQAGCENRTTDAIAKRSIEDKPNIPEGYCGNITDEWNNISGALCYNETLCACEWDTGPPGICTAREFKQQTCDGESIIVTPTDECFWKVEDDDGCNNGELFMHVIWTYVKGGGAVACGDSWEADIDCGDVVKLNFFTIINLIAAIVIIGIIYYFYTKRNSKKIKKTKKKKIKKK